MFAQAINTLAKAKLIRNAKHKNLFKLVVAFNVTQTNAKNNYIFPTQKHCAYVSGDIALNDLAYVLNCAKQKLQTNNIQLVS